MLPATPAPSCFTPASSSVLSAGGTGTPAGGICFPCGTRRANASSQRISTNKIELVEAEILAADSIDSLEALRETETDTVDVATADIAGSWQPTMPPLSTAPSVPWRRPQMPQATAYIQPHLVIDDADPDSADRQRERDQRAAREHSRLSFLPPILLDREDRSARQGGLTLAVIILLIAATLTLSYLMRRPSARGDGVTLLDGHSELLG